MTGWQFGRLSYRTMDALLHRRNLRTQQEDYRSGVLCSLVANYMGAMAKSGKTFKPADFFSSLAVPDAPHQQTPEEMREMLRDFAVLQKA